MGWVNHQRGVDFAAFSEPFAAGALPPPELRRVLAFLEVSFGKCFLQHFFFPLKKTMALKFDEENDIIPHLLVEKL